jgi:hypothetical protein
MTLDEIAVHVCREVAELPDRTSPHDWPDAMLVTHDELRAIVLDAVAAVLPVWQPIATAPKDGTPLRLFSEGFINPDFNPGGSVEGQWCDDLGWIGAVWNAEQDCWDANEIVPTHWQPLPPPPGVKGDANG